MALEIAKTCCLECGLKLVRTSELYLGCEKKCCKLVQHETAKAGQELRVWDAMLRRKFGPAPYRLGETYGQWLTRLKKKVPLIPPRMVVEFEFPVPLSTEHSSYQPDFWDTPANEAIDLCNEWNIRLCHCGSQLHFQKEETEMTGKEACDKLKERFTEFKLHVCIEFEKCSSCGKAEPELTCKVIIPNAKPVAGRSYKEDMTFESATIEDVVMAALLWNASPLKGADVEQIVEATQ